MQSNDIESIWIDAELWVEGVWNPEDDIVDVIVTLTDGGRWTATICSFKHVQTLTAKWSSSGECLGGRYLWAKNLILVKDTSRKSIEETMMDLIRTGEFESALGKVSAG